MKKKFGRSKDGLARILEVFSSLQGEGPYLGARQVFVRLGGCNLGCDYCDEPGAIAISSGELWSSRKTREAISRLLRARPHEAVSWTGGEPLLQAGFLAGMMGWVRGKGLKNYLETNGTRVEDFRELAALCDVVAMDIKLPSATGRETWSEHLEFLRVAPRKTFVKVALTAASTKAEWRQVIRLLLEAAPSGTLVLQPATELGGLKSISPALAVQFMRQAKAYLPDVRIIPQWHPVWGLR